MTAMAPSRVTATLLAVACAAILFGACAAIPGTATASAGKNAATAAGLDDRRRRVDPTGNGLDRNEVKRSGLWREIDVSGDGQLDRGEVRRR